MRPTPTGNTSRPEPNGPESAPKRDRLAEVARGGTLNLIGAAAAAVATVGITVLITRRFSRPMAGTFFTATSVFLIAEAIGSLGAKTGTVYFIARLRQLGAEAERRIPLILRAAMIPVLVMSTVVAVGVLLLASPLAHVFVTGHLSHSHVSPAGVAQMLRILALALPFAALLDSVLGATRGYRNMRCTVVVDNIGRSVGQFLGVLIAAAAGSAALLAPLWVVPYIPAVIVGWLWLSRIRKRHSPHPERSAGAAPPSMAGGSRIARRRLDNANPRGFWRFTGPRGLAALAQITLQRIDIVLVAIMRGPAEAAVYTAATRFLVVGQWGNMAISNAAQPRFTELFTLRDRQGANDVYQVTTAWLVLLTWPLYLLAVVYGPEVLSVFGHSYRGGQDVIIILGLTMLLATMCGQVDMVLITSGRTSWSLGNALLTVGVNVGVDLLLIPRYGITGAAIGWSVAIVVNNLVPLAQIAAVMRLHPLGRATLVAGALSALSFGAVPWAIRGIFGTSLLPSVAGGVVGCLVMAVGLWLFRDALRLSALVGPVLQRTRLSGRPVLHGERLSAR
jgi:O-antigen/teichoic acid export membrane protein